MTSSARFSTPVYLDPAKGKYCGSCRHCDMDDPYIPSRTANCLQHDNTTQINRVTTCKDYLPRELPHILNLEAQ